MKRSPAWRARSITAACGRLEKPWGLTADISCCISPQQYEDLFLPPLIDTMRTVDHRLYHLDGTVALQHLDLLLSVPEIDAIQWVPGAGRRSHPAVGSADPAYPKAGKAVLVQTEAAEVAALLDCVSARGLCIATQCATQQEAETWWN